MKTLHRYVIRELLFPFLMGVTIFTFILIMDRIFTLTDLIVKYGVSVLTVAELLVYILPSTFAITIPMGCLVAVMVGFSRLKSDNEIMAMKASGVSLLPMVGILLLLGLGLTVGMTAFNNQVLPQANHGYRNLYFNIVSQRAAIVVQEHIFVEDFDGYVFRVGSKNPVTGELKDVAVFVRGKKDGDPIRAILAQRGQLISDVKSRRVMLKLEQGIMQLVQPKDLEAFSKIDFDTTFLDLDINRELSSQLREVEKSPREMSMADITREIRVRAPRGENVNLLRVEYHKKISIPFACFAFILIGAPLGILAPRSGRYFSYFLGVMLIFIYYIFISLGETFGSEGRMSPFLSMWLPNLLLLAAGAYGMLWVLWEAPPLWPPVRRWLTRFAGRGRHDALENAGPRRKA